MNSVAGSNWNDVVPSSSSPRADDDELGQRIALALRERRPTMDFEPLLAPSHRSRTPQRPVTAAHDHELVPADLSLDGCQHGRALDDMHLAQWVLLEWMTPQERDERAAVVATGRIVEDLVAGYGPDGQVGTHPNAVPPPPVEQLGIAIAAIGDDMVGLLPPRDETTYAVHVPAPPRRRSRPIEQPAEITCTTAAVLATPPTQAAASVVPPQVRSRRVLWPWIGLAAIVGVGAVHVVAPKFWPGVADRAREGIDSLRDTARGREALDMPPAPLAAAAIAADPSTTLAEAREPSPPAASIDAMPTASGVIPRSAGVPPAPSLATAIIHRAPAKARAKARAPSPTPAAVSENEVIAAPIDRTASPFVDALPAVVATPEVPEPTMPTSTTPTTPANDPPTDVPPRQEPPSPTPPVREPPREIDDPDAPTPIEGDAAK